MSDLHAQLSEKKLDELLKFGSESMELDFKEQADLNANGVAAELAKDVLAMANTNGGHIVIGVEDGTIAVRGVPSEHLKGFEDGDTSVNNKLARYIRPVVVHCKKHVRNVSGREVIVVLLYVEPSPELVAAAADANTQLPGGGQKPVFRQGDIFWRRGSSSERPTDVKAVPSHRRMVGSGKPTPLKSGRVVARPKPKAKNPYSATYIAEKGMFKGRREQIEALLDHIETGTHTAVFGLQRMGKTSLVETAINEHLPRRDELKNRVVYVNIDFQQANYRRYADLFDLFLRSIRDAYSSPTTRAKAELAIHDFETAKGAVGHRQELFRPFAAALKQVVGATPKKVVLFLDEFSEWCRAIEDNRTKRPSDRPRHPHEELVDVDLMQFLGSILKDNDLRDRLICVLAVRPFVAEYDRQHNLQLLKLLQPITLYHLDPSAATALITEPLREILEVEPEAAEHLKTVTGGHPYLIQYILKPLVDRIMRTGGSLTRVAVVEECERVIAAGEEQSGPFAVLDSDYSVESVLSAAPDHGKGLLALIAKYGDPETGCWVADQTLRREMFANRVAEPEVEALLSQLCRAKIIEERDDGDGLCYRMVVPLLRERYLKQNFYKRHFRPRRG